MYIRIAGSLLERFVNIYIFIQMALEEFQKYIIIVNFLRVFFIDSLDGVQYGCFNCLVAHQ